MTMSKPFLKLVGGTPGAKVKGTDPMTPLQGGGEPPYDGGMDERVKSLEEFAGDAKLRLERIETRLDTTATKADMTDLKAELIKWMVGLAFGISAAAITVMTFVLNNAVPKAVPPAPTPPVVIQMPYGGTPVQVPAQTASRP